MSEMEMCLKITGRVQRVGFRRWAVRLAHNIGGIQGFVCNMNDGSVLVYIQGENENISRYLQKIYQGPLFARVDYIESVPQDKILFPPIEKGVFKKI